MFKCFRIANFLLLAALLAAAPACRTGATPEAGVDARLFEQPGASIGFNDQGYWFAVAAEPAGEANPLADYVMITHDGQTELFYSVARGERAAQLLPLTPVESPWFAAAVEAGVTPRFVDTLDDVETTDALGLWEGEGSSEVRWLGPNAPNNSTALAIPAGAPDSILPLYNWAQGVVTVDNGQVSRAQGELGEGPYLVLPEGEDVDQTLSVVSLVGTDFFEAGGDDIDVSAQEPVAFSEDTVSNEYAALPVGRKAGADVLFFEFDDRLFVFNAQPDETRLGGELRLVPAVAEIPLALRERTSATNTVRGFEALREGRPLAASFWLRPEQVAVADNPDATPLRLAELAAAAKRTQWSRAALLEGTDSMSADRMLYLARAYALEGDLAQAKSYAERAAKAFADWPEPARYTGAARAQLLRAKLAFAEGDAALAAELATDASRNYESAGDELRRAEAESRLADYFFAAGELDQAIVMARAARSRYYHGGSPYFSALAEIELAQLLLENGQTDEALEMAGYALKRMEKFGEPVGRARAAIVHAVAQKRAGKKTDISGELESAYAQARDRKDLTATAMAAAARVNEASVDGGGQILELGRGLAMMSESVDDPIVARQAQRALAALCVQGLPELARDDDGGWDASQACDSALADLAVDPSTLRAWLAQGWRALQSAQLEAARATAKQLAQRLDEQSKKTSPVLAADVLFFRHAVRTAPTAEPDAAEPDANEQDLQLVEEAMGLLESGVDPKNAASKLHEMARTYRARGLADVSTTLAAQAMRSARESKQYEKERELLFFLLDTYQQAGQPADVLELARDGRKIVSRAGPGSDALEARVLIYQSDAEYRLGRNSDAGLHRSNALETAKNSDDATHLGLLLLAADLDLDRRAVEAAELAIVGGLNIYGNLGPKTRSEKQLVLPLTRLHTLHGEVGLRLGKLEPAKTAFNTAIELSADADAAEMLALRARALAGIAGLAAGSDDAANAQNELRSVLDRLARFESPAPAIDAHRTAVVYYTDAGDASAALEVAESVHDRGFALAPREIAPCVLGRTRLFAGKTEQAVDDLEVCKSSNAANVRGAFAAILLSFIDESSSPDARAAWAAEKRQEFDDRLTEAEGDRLELIERLAAPADQFDDRRAERLKEQADTSQTASAVDAYVTYLLSVGRVDEAAAYTDEHSSVFYKQGQESPGTLIRLRLETMVRQLQPVEASLYARRALSESAQLADQERARIELLLAENAVVAGRWWMAAEHLQAARRAAGGGALVKEIDAFAKKFPPLGNGE